MKVDIAIAGGGLSGALIAWRLRVCQPALSLAVIEQGERLGGNHTWSFHSTDLPTAIDAWMETLIVRRWERQHVKFIGQERTLRTGYCSTTSERLHEVIAPLLGEGLVCSARIKSVAKDHVALEDGRVIEAGAVIDARGQRRSGDLTIGFQKFLGQTFRFEQPHGLKNPIIMDATVSQQDGYRFVYVLPFTEDTALVEDTYYADGEDLDRASIRARIADYCANNGWVPVETTHEEDGILPIALAGDIDRHLEAITEGVGVAGLGAGLFHPMTGYSLPDAAALAQKLSQATNFSGPAISHLTREHARMTWYRRAFYRLLSRLLFYAGKPEGRHKVLARFYRLNNGLIERFYAANSSKADKTRVLVGKPPVSFFRALDCVDEIHWRDQKWLPLQEDRGS